MAVQSLENALVCIVHRGFFTHLPSFRVRSHQISFDCISAQMCEHGIAILLISQFWSLHCTRNLIESDASEIRIVVLQCVVFHVDFIDLHKFIKKKKSKNAGNTYIVTTTAILVPKSRCNNADKLIP